MDYVNKGLIMIAIILILLLTEKFINMPTDEKKINQPIKSKFKNIISLFEWSCMNYNEHTAMCVRRNEKWQGISYQSYYYLVEYLAVGLQDQGLKKGDRVCFLGYNAPGWFITQMAVIKCGGVAVGIYPNAETESIVQIMNDCQPKFLVVEDNDQLEKLLPITPLVKNIEYLEKVISYSEVIRPELLDDLRIPYVHINLLIKEGHRIGLFDNVIAKLNDVVILVYTSGTTGKSKGVMITNKNIISIFGGLIRHLKVNSNSNGLMTKRERILSYLPLNHIVAQMTDIFLSLGLGTTVYFGDKEILKTTMIKNLREIRPTIFIGVPRVWEKIREGIEKEASDSTMYYLGKMVMPSFVGGKILREIGLNKCKFAVTAAAPLSIETKKFFVNFGLPLHEIYGMSETTGPLSIANPQQMINGSVGEILASIKVKINGEDEGELLIKGDSLFKGYLNYGRAVNKNGWFFTGDLGKIDKNGILYITGRKKDLIITSGGENIAPVPIEETFKNQIPFVQDVIVIGDRRKFLSALITLKKEFVESEYYTNLTDKDFDKMINDAIEKVNSKAKSRVHQIKKVNIVPREFSYETGELTNTMKLKRKYIESKYIDLINEMYS